MGALTAVAFDPWDMDSFTNRAPINEVKDISLIAGKKHTAAPASTVWADLQLWSEALFLFLIELESRTFYTN